MIKCIVLLTRKSGITREEFSQYWYEKHSSIVLKTFPELRRYIQNHAVKLSDRDPPFDGVAESWFDSIESTRRSLEAYAGDKGKELREDEEKFLDRGKMPLFICEEKVIK